MIVALQETGAQGDGEIVIKRNTENLIYLSILNGRVAAVRIEARYRCICKIALAHCELLR